MASDKTLVVLIHFNRPDSPALKLPVCDATEFSETSDRWIDVTCLPCIRWIVDNLPEFSRGQL